MYKIPTFLISLTFLTLATGSGCITLERIETEVNNSTFVQLDPEVTEQEKTVLLEAIYDLLHMAMQVDSTSAFFKIFDGRTASAALRYMDDRINYVVSARTDPRLRINSYSDPGLTFLDARTFGAANLGTWLWLSFQNRRGIDPEFQIGGQKIKIHSTRVGIIQLGQSFSAQRHVTPIHRISTLLHEARHSDCHGRHCGHLHVTCPAGHEYAGKENGCDAHPWGAFAVKAVFAKAVADHCTNCSHREVQDARMIAADAFSRLLYSKDDLLSGTP